MAKKTSKVTPIAASVIAPVPEPPPLVLAPAPQPDVKLDLGGGQNVREGFEGVDLLAPNAKHKVDLFKFPWPWLDESIAELHASHFVEHIPAREVEERDLRSYTRSLRRHNGRVLVDSASWDEADERFVGQDFFLAFFDECWRILKPNGTMTVIVPALQHVRAFQDPTHRHFNPAERFLYLAAEWRKANKLDHYRVRCNFGCNVVPTVPQELTLLHPEVQARRMREGWNVTQDWYATLVKLPAS